MRSFKFNYFARVIFIFSMAILASTSLLTTPAFAASGDIVVTVQDQLGNSLTGATFTFACTGNSGSLAVTDGGAGDVDASANGTIFILAATAGGATPHCETNGESFTTDNISYSGFITETTPLTTYSTGAQNNTTTSINYVLISQTLKTELGGAVTSIATGNDRDGTPSADVTVTGGTGVTITATAVAANVIYIAATGDGGGNDSVTIQVQNVTTADTGGTATADAATLVKSSVTDTGNVINTATIPEYFDIGAAAAPINDSSVGFKYPLKVLAANELGSAMNISSFDTKTFNSVAVYAASTSTGYFASSATQATLSLVKTGYVNSDTTNTSLASGGSTGVTTTQDTQVVLTMGTGSIRTGTVLSASTTVRGAQFGQRISFAREGDSLSLTGATVTAGSGATSCTESSSFYFCAVPEAQDGVANDVNFSLTGYVTDTSGDTGDRTSGASARVTVSVTGIKFQLKAIVTDELGTAINIASLDTINFNAGAPTISSTNVAYWASAPVTQAVLTIREDGYVNSDTTNTSLASILGIGGVTTSASAQVVITMGSGAVHTGTTISADASVKGLQFSHKIVVKDELGTALTPTSATAGASLVACTVSSNSVYCPVVLADDNTLTNGFVVVKDGYVTASVDLAAARSAGTDAQQLVTMTTSNGLDFSHKIVVKDELGTALTPTSVTAGASLVACTVSSNSVYCPVVLADDNTLTNGFVVVKDGYVTASVDLAAARSAGTDAQQLVTMTTSNGLDFSHKVTVIAVDASSITGATVTLDGTTCAESTGVYYCEILVADDGGVSDLIVSKTSFDTSTSSSEDRTTNATVQKTYSITLTATAVASSSSSGGGGGGGGGSSSSFDLTSTPSDKMKTYTHAVSLPSDGKIVRPTLILNETLQTSLEIQKDTLSTNQSGRPYSGEISVPKRLGADQLPASLPDEASLELAFTIQTDADEVHFDKNIELSFPISAEADSSKIKVYYYNESTEEYVWLTGAVLSEDGLSMSVQVAHLTTFVVVEGEISGAEVEVVEQQDFTVSTTESTGDETSDGEEVDSLSGSFADTVGHWAADYIQTLYDMGVVTGRSSDSFAPDESLTRAELVKIALLTFGYEVNPESVSTFTDVSTEAWYSSYVALAQAEGIIQGYEDGTFLPDAAVNRAEALKILLGAAKKSTEVTEYAPFTDVDQSSWYANVVNYAYANGVVSGMSATGFAPDAFVTRAEIAKMAVKLYEL
jgi:hypothetical protein